MPFAPSDRLSSPQNPRIKQLLRLQQKSAERRALGLTLVEGLRELTDELWAPERLSAAGIGPDEQAFGTAVEGVCPGARVAA